MSLDPFREVRDAVRPSAAAGHLTDMRATQIANRYRVDVADVRSMYDEEHARLHPQTPPAVAERSPDEPTPPAAIPDPFPDQPATTGGDGQVVPAVEPSDAPAPAGTIDTKWPGEALPPVNEHGCMAGPLEDGMAHMCDLPAGHDAEHYCGTLSHRDLNGEPCGRMWDDPADEAEDTITAWPETTFAATVSTSADGTMTVVAASDEPRQSNDRTLGWFLDRAAGLLDHPDAAVRRSAEAATRAAAALTDAVHAWEAKDQLLAEQARIAADRAILDARWAEIEQALAAIDGDDTGPEQPPASTPVPPAPVGGGRANCPDCGKEFYVNGMPRHRAACRKQRGAA